MFLLYLGSMPLEPAMTRCPSCGAPLAASVAECPYCRTPANSLKGFELLKAAKNVIDDVAFQCEERLRRDPSDPAALFMLGIVFFKRGLYAEAAEYLKKAADLSPTAPEIYYFLAITEAHRRDWMSRVAEQYAEKAERLAPHSKEIQSLRVLLRGIERFGTRDGASDRAEALAEFREAMALDPDNPYGYFFAGQIFEQAGWTREAVEMFQAAEKRQCDDPRVHIRLGLLYRDSGETQAAVEQLKKALAWEPGNAAVRKVLESLEQG